MKRPRDLPLGGASLRQGKSKISGLQKLTQGGRGTPRGVSPTSPTRPTLAGNPPEAPSPREGAWRQEQKVATPDGRKMEPNEQLVRLTYMKTQTPPKKRTGLAAIVWGKGGSTPAYRYAASKGKNASYSVRGGGIYNPNTGITRYPDGRTKGGKK